MSGDLNQSAPQAGSNQVGRVAAARFSDDLLAVCGNSMFRKIEHFRYFAGV